MTDSSCNSSVVDLTGNSNDRFSGVGGSVVIDNHLQTLEKLNKEIENIKHEVELEQRRLTHCQTKEADSKRSVSKVTEKNANPASYGTDRSQARLRPNKYVVDNSQPRTDLEYDPMSNFSADFGSYKQKVKNGLKRVLTVEEGGATKASNPTSPKTGDDYDDDVLIIDAPMSPDKKRSRQQKSETQQDVTNSPVITKPPPDREVKVKAEMCSPVEAKTPSSLEQEQMQNENMSCFTDAVNEALKGLPPVGETTELQDSSWLSKLLHEEAVAISLNKKVKKEAASTDENYFPNKSGLELLSEMSELMQSKEAFQSVPPAKVELVPTDCPQQTCDAASGSADLTAEARTEQSSGKQSVILIRSSSDDDVNYSDLDVSDSDPMEECYRIFMEANEEEGKRDGPVVPSDSEKPVIDAKPAEVAAVKKRLAHQVKNPEQPGVKSRPEPKVLVPLQEPAPRVPSQGSVSKMHHIQHQASMLTACVNGGQAFLNHPGRPEPQIPVIQTATQMQRPVVAGEYLSYIPAGSTLVEVGNNVHLILPQGAFQLPVASNASPVTSVLTPITHVQIRKATFPPAVSAGQRHRAPPQVIPPPSLRPSLNPRVMPSAAPVQQQVAVVKPAAAKRKGKEAYKATNEKVPHDIRQRYVNMFTEEILKTTPNVKDAFEKALAEEKTVYNRSMNKLKYLSVAVNALKKLKNQSALPAAGSAESSGQKTRGNIALDLQKVKDEGDPALYESLMDFVLTEDKLIESNFPIQHPEKPGCAILFANNKKTNADPLKKICCRCGATYSVSRTGKHLRKEECNYHPGRGVERKVPGGVETRYSCCQGVMGAPGCQLFKLHVHDSLSMEGFVTTAPKPASDASCPGVYAVNCEMCYTIHGLELLRVTVVNSSLHVIYDTFVKPNNEVIDYNTRVSGISEEDLKGSCSSMTDVQKTLLSLVGADTVLIGHELETDFCALKLFHGLVVDTSVVFPHRLGPPHKLTLNTLTAEYLRKIIQESACGHDTAEDATACMALMLWKLRDGKVKK